MNQTLIIQTGSTFPALSARRGDFTDWVLAGMGLTRASALVADVEHGGELPGCDQLAGVVITGSHAMVTQHLDWSERTAEWLAGAAARHIPILGICYGHQLLAYALGGEAADNPHGREFGTTDVHLNGRAQRDSLFGGLPNPLKAHVCHAQSVVRLPERAIALASSARERYQAFVVNDCAWGVQFHPEFDADAIRFYINHEQDKLAREGQDVDRLLASVQATPDASSLLERFARLIHGGAA
jgi:GMP synthase (glutamine-hydrolysing)